MLKFNNSYFLDIPHPLQNIPHRGDITLFNQLRSQVSNYSNFN